MPYAKLTLRLDQDLIEWGKTYAKTQGTSLSKFMEEALRREKRTRIHLLDKVDYLPANQWGIQVPREIGEEQTEHKGPEVSDAEAKQRKHREYMNLE